MRIRDWSSDVCSSDLSCDGGWRDLDKTIGGILRKEGVPVIGIDSLRYFWNEKTPDDLARTLARVIDRYGEAWGRRRVVLVGYSFGASVLPFVVHRLPPSERRRVDHVSLRAIGRARDGTPTAN